MKKFCFTALIILLAALFGPSTSFASSATSSVGSARVEEGHRLTGSRAGYAARPDRANDWRARQHIDWSLNGDHALVLISQIAHQQGDNWEYRNTTVQHRWQLWDRSVYGWDGGVRFIYTQNDGDKGANEVQARFLVDIPLAEGWELRHNMIAAWQVGAERAIGTRIEWRHQISHEWDLDPHNLIGANELMLGVESFYDMGRLNELNGYDQQRHQLGPVIQLGWDNGISAQLGYRVGLTERAEDHIVSFFLNKRF